MRVALVYDRVNKWGGAERVLLALNRIFPNAPLYTSVYDSQKASWAKVFPKVIPSFLQNFPFSSHHEFYAPFMPLAFESFSFDDYDLVISISSEAAKGIITKPGTLHICYCLTPTRYLWSGYGEYFKNPIFRILSYPLVIYLRTWDRMASSRPDVYIAISEEVKKRINRYYKRDSKVIYPPLMLGRKYQVESVRNKKIQNTGYFLIVSRLVPYKRVDIAIEVFNKLGFPLKIVGTGSEMAKLKRKAFKNIEFLGYLTEEELVGYYQDCSSLIFCGEEDFGLTVLEANSFGKPVIAYKGGGALETVIEGKTGIFFNSQNSKSLEEAIKKFGKMSFDAKECMKNADKFRFEYFKEEFLKEIERLSK